MVAYKVRGAQTAELTWDLTPSEWIDVFRDGSLVDVTEDDGFYIDITGVRGGGTATYQVCEAGTDTCSNQVTVEF